MAVTVKDSGGRHVSLPTVAHTNPCRECPFRRKSAPGYLGGGTVEEWMADLTFGDTAFVCHMAEQKGKRHLCAGSMIHYLNSCKMPRDRDFAAMLKHYAKNSVAVFDWPHEFQAHHAGGVLALTKPSETAVAVRRRSSR